MMDRDAFTVKWNNCILTASDDAELLRDLDAVIHDAIATELEAQARRIGREAKKFGEASRVYELRFQAAKLERRAKRLREDKP